MWTWVRIVLGLVALSASLDGDGPGVGVAATKSVPAIGTSHYGSTSGTPAALGMLCDASHRWLTSTGPSSMDAVLLSHRSSDARTAVLKESLTVVFSDIWGHVKQFGCERVLAGEHVVEAKRVTQHTCRAMETGLRAGASDGVSGAAGCKVQLGPLNTIEVGVLCGAHRGLRGGLCTVPFRHSAISTTKGG